MKYAYVRVSSKEQSLDRQLDILSPYNCDVTYMEKESAKSIKDRPEFQKLISEVKEGDEIYVSELSRFARSVRDLANIVDDLTDKGVRLYSVKEGFDLTTSTGRMVCYIIGAVAQFEREYIKERQQQGYEAARARGKHLGRKRKYGRNKKKMEGIFTMCYIGEYTILEAATEAHMNDSTFYYQFKMWRKENGLDADLRKCR